MMPQVAELCGGSGMGDIDSLDNIGGGISIRRGGALGSRTGAGGAHRASNAGMFETEGIQFKLFWRSNVLR
jgi:hypothetical protein